MQQEEALAPPERRSGRADVYAGLVVAAAGTLLFVMASNIGDAVRPAPIGPATLPKTLSVLLIVSGLGLVLLGLRHRPVLGIEADVLEIGEAEAVEGLIHRDEPRVPPGKLAVMVTLFIGYALIFIPLGYMLSTTLYLGVVTTFIDRKRWKRNVVFAVVFAVVVYYAFTELLSVRLPVGILG